MQTLPPILVERLCVCLRSFSHTMSWPCLLRPQFLCARLHFLVQRCCCVPNERLLARNAVVLLAKCKSDSTPWTAPTSCLWVKHCIRMIALLRRIDSNHLFTLRIEAFTLNIEKSDCYWYDHDGPHVARWPRVE